MKAYTVKEEVQLTVEAESIEAAVVKVRQILLAKGLSNNPQAPQTVDEAFNWGYWCREADGDREPVTHLGLVDED